MDRCIVCGFIIVGRPAATKKWPSNIETPICSFCIATYNRYTFFATKKSVATFINPHQDSYGDFSGDNKMSEEETTIKVPVVAFEQKGVQNYVGVMKAKDLLEVWHVERFMEEQLDRGYQRQKEEERMRQVSSYVEKCPLPVIPAILASVREGARFITTDKNIGILEIPLRKGAIEIIDGQHRVGGFEVLKRLVEGERVGRRRLAEEEIAKYEELLNFEIPVHFIDAESAVKRLDKVATPEAKENMLKELGKDRLGPEDVERVHFFVINKTQKAIRPALKDTLAYLIHAAGIRGIPIIEKEMWKAEIATPLTLDLHFMKDSPLRGLINISGTRGLGRPIQLNSFVTSLRPLAEKNAHFRSMSPEQRYNFLKVYWGTIRELCPEAFDNALRGEYLILKTIGVYVLNCLASDVLNWCRAKGVEELTKDEVKNYLKPIKEFDWGKDTSTIRAYGGAKGVQEAYKVLLKFLGERGIQEATERYEELTREGVRSR